ncbi:MAG: FAD-dependent monooxygenase [Rhodospirillaceae bacterium]
MSPHSAKNQGSEGPGAPNIVIAGGGPVGLVAALALARAGHTVTVFEADADVCDGSRAICISRRSLQLLDRLGVAAPFLAKGLPWTEGRSYLGTAEVFHLRMAHTSEDRFPPFINLQQFHAERFLADACLATGRVDLKWNHRISGVQASPEGIELLVEHAGATFKTRADWLVAADGGRSVVREQLGLALEGQRFERRYLIADIELACDWPTERKVWFDPLSNPGSTIIMHRQPDNVWRIDTQLLEGESEDEALREDNIRTRIAAHLSMVGLHGSWRLLWKSIYRAHTLSLGDYVHGRVVFAGDAAHLVPIFGVRGLNSGIDDAANLAWKLALVAGHAAPAGILASYTEERRAACRENIASATKSTWFMSPPSDGFVLARDAVLELAVNYPAFRVLIDPRQSAAHVYRSSAIAAPDSPLVGLPLPETRMADGRSLHDLLGSGFAVLVFTDGPSAVTPRAIGAIAYLEVQVSAGDPCAAVLGAKVGTFLFVRPDGYVAAAADGVDKTGLPEAARRALDKIGLPQKESRHVPAA